MPTSSTESDGWAFAHARVPVTISRGAKSPPIASTMTRTAPSSTVRTVARSTRLCRLLRLFLLDLYRGPAVVVAANRAGLMNLLRLLAVRACLENRQCQRMMGTTVTLSCVGDSPLRNTH